MSATPYFAILTTYINRDVAKTYLHVTSHAEVMNILAKVKRHLNVPLIKLCNDEKVVVCTRQPDNTWQYTELTTSKDVANFKKEASRPAPAVDALPFPF